MVCGIPNNGIGGPVVSKGNLFYRLSIKPNMKKDRRTFIKTTAATAAGIGLMTHGQLTDKAEALTMKIMKDGMPKRALGKTGFDVGLFSLGGEATVEQQDRRQDAAEIINRAIDLGVNYIDTSPTYGGGGSETNIGSVMRTRRDEVFLATKTHDRSYDGTLRLFESSLNRLQTHRIDLYQVHNIRINSDVTDALGSDGAVRAIERLRNEGAVHYVGITGHRDPEVLLWGIREYDFDTLLMSLNAADIHYKPFQTELLETAVKKQMGIIAMKVPALGRIFKEDGITSMEQALGYVYSFPVNTAIVGISTIAELEENVRIARNFKPFSKEEMAQLERRTEPYYREPNFFKFYW